ncbi:hypothetical protein ACFQS7_08190 [Dankookia sp. GCM10030260]|uniref:hypothetical protein n=1 Tax=Dankookia sp. GCM10030260 TaxID=3273390 RepID=UPI0036214398
MARIEVEQDRSESYALKTGELAISPHIETEQRFRYAGFLRDNGVKAIVNVIILGGRDRPPDGLLQVASRVPRGSATTPTPPSCGASPICWPRQWSG